MLAPLLDCWIGLGAHARRFMDLPPSQFFCLFFDWVGGRSLCPRGLWLHAPPETVNSVDDVRVMLLVVVVCEGIIPELRVVCVCIGLLSYMVTSSAYVFGSALFVGFSSAMSYVCCICLIMSLAICVL